jgi:hypothetical protein
MYMSKYLLLTLTACFVFCACSSDDESEPIVEPTTGTVTITQGGGQATVQQPAVANAGQPAEVTLSQRATYNDVNGTTYTCEPKATVSLTIKADTVRAKSLADLLSTTQTTDQSQNGQSPVTHRTEQTFTIGGQTAKFLLEHEVYTYTTSQKTNIEMPFIALSAAKQGKATTTEMTRSAVTSIRLTPLPTTRGTYTTTQAYHVQAAFTVDAQSQHTEAPQAQTLSFEADYIALVEDTHEYPDPETTFNYTLATSGTTSTRSPFTMKQGEKQMQLTWQQVAQHSWFSFDELQQQALTAEPQAQVTLTMATDTVWADSRAGLDSLQTIEGNTITIGGQMLTLDYHYDVPQPWQIDGQAIEVPHMELGLPEIKSVTVNYLDGVTIPDVDGDVYEVTARITQELKTVNATNQSSETLEYVVKYIGVEQVKLVNVTYRKHVEWEFCEDEWIFWPIVYRDRTYSNGVTVTDTFADYGHLCWYAVAFQPYPLELSGVVEYDGGKIIYSPLVVTAGLGNEGCDTILVVTRHIGVVDLNKIRPLEIGDAYYNTGMVKDWNKYRSSKSYEEMGLDVPLNDVTVNGADSVSTQPSGWYYHLNKYHRSLGVIYEEPNVPFLFEITIEAAFHDQYLVIDGEMIWFIEEAFGEYHYDWNEEDITEGGSPTKRYTFSGWNIFYGLKFSATGIITVYQLKDGARSATNGPAVTLSQESQWLSPMQPTQKAVHSKTYAPKGQYRYGFISGGDIHGHGKGPRPFTPADDLRHIIKEQQVEVEVK